MRVEGGRWMVVDVVDVEDEVRMMMRRRRRRRRKLAAAGCSEEESPLAPLVLLEFHKSDADDEDKVRQWQKNHDSYSYYYCQHDDVLLP